MMRQTILIGVVLAAACGEPAPEGAISVQVDTTDAGTVVVTSQSPGGEARVPWAVDPAGALLIGTVDGPDETRFGRTGAVAVGPDGQIFVPDGQAQTVRVFDVTGEYLRSIGRPGEGPGEFRSLDGVLVTDDEILTRDPMLNRISRFNREGRFIDSFLMERPFAQFSRQASFWIDSAGSVYDFTHVGTTMAVDSLAVIYYEPGGRVDTVVTHSAEPRRLLLRDAEGEPQAAAQVPFAAFGRATVSGSGLVFAGSGAEYEITVHDGSSIVRRIRKVEAAQPVPDWAPDTVEVVIRRLGEDFPGGSVDRDELPQSQPYFNGLVVDALGYLWVPRQGLTQTPASRYDIFAPSGAFIGFVESPEMIVDQVGEVFIAGRTRDELGVERVMVLALDRTEVSDR